MNLWNKRSVDEKFLVLFVLIFILRIIFISSVPLIDDEAYHWSWTQNLQLSYFDHPGMIAWLESLSLAILGPTLWGVRLPSFICYVLTVIVSWKMTQEIFSKKAAHFVALMILWTPLWGFGGYVASPEPPFMLCWVSATWVFWKSVRPEYPWPLKKSWLYLGLIMGVGLNSKFIIALLAPGFALFLLSTANYRRHLLSIWPWVGFLVATLLCAPIFIWNSIYDWPGFQYQFHDRHTGASFSWSRWGEFLSAQVLFFTPALYILILTAFIVSLFKFKNIQWKFLFCLTAPSMLIFYPQPLWADYKPHWSGAACLLLLMGAAHLWVEGLTFKNRILIGPQSKKWAYAIAAFLIPINIFIYTPFLGPWMPTAYRWLNPQGEWKTTYDLSNEFYGWKELGDYLNRRQREVHALTGRKPFLAAHRYENTAQTYWGSQQKVFMLSPVVSHYTVMQNKSGVLENLKGQDAFFITSEKYPAEVSKYAKFDQCSAEVLKTYRGPANKLVQAREFTIFYCKNFQGIIDS